MRGTTTCPLPDWVGIIFLLPVIYLVAKMLLKFRYLKYQIGGKSIQEESLKYVVCEIKYHQIISVKEIVYLAFFTRFMLFLVKKTFIETAFMNVVFVKTTSGDYYFSPVNTRLFVEQIQEKLRDRVMIRVFKYSQ